MDKIDKYVYLFEEYNSHTNLMSKNDLVKLKEKHIPDSLSISSFFQKYGECKTLLDIGTGGGLPSVPIAIMYDNIQVYAIDSIMKKIKFLNSVKEKLPLDNFFPICTRIEDFEKREFFDIVTTRAVAGLSSILEYSAPFTKTGGYIVAYKSKNSDEELSEAENAIKSLSLELVEKMDVSSIHIENIDRCLLIFKKNKKTDLKYPRQNNCAKKNPL